jgi:choice-of-anchor A domain-containing protein
MTKTMLAVMMALAVMPWSNSFGQSPMTDASNIQIQIPLPNFAVFGTESVTINDGLNENTRCIKGNVGTGGTDSGDLYLNKCLVFGNILVTTASVASLGSHGAYAGRLILGQVSGVGATMNSISGYLGGLPPDLTLASLINQNVTFTNSSTTGGTYVINIVGSASTTNPYTWTFVAAAPGDKFVVNIGGDLTVAQLKIAFSGDIDPNNVVFNLTGSSCSAEVNKSDSIWFGVILGPQCELRVHNPFPFIGRLLGKTVTVDSGAAITRYYSDLPK